MSRAAKIALLLVAGMIAVLLLAGVLVYAVGGARMAHVYRYEVTSVKVPTGEAAITEGKRLFFIRGCADCHGDDGAGKLIFETPLARSVGANLTALMPTLSDDDVVRALRHGVGKDGTMLMTMPAQEYRKMSSADIGHLIAYLRTMKPIARALPPSEVKPLGRFMYVCHVMKFFPAETFNHENKPPPPPEPGDTVAYGEYLSSNCVDCHGKHFSGGPIPGATALGDPANLTPDETGLKDWTQEQFVTTLRTGVNPSGKKLDPTKMPWPSIGQMNDVEMAALWRYLRTLQPLPRGSR